MVLSMAMALQVAIEHRQVLKVERAPVRRSIAWNCACLRPGGRFENNRRAKFYDTAEGAAPEFGIAALGAALVRGRICHAGVLIDDEVTDVSCVFMNIFLRLKGLFLKRRLDREMAARTRSTRPCCAKNSSAKDCRRSSITSRAAASAAPAKA